jgi:hypothetical protein
LFLCTSQKCRKYGNISRTFFNSSISSALRISHSRLSTTASLVKRLISSSSFVLSGPFCDIDNEEVGRWVRGDDGPATEELSDDFRMGEAREALDDGRPSLVDGEPGFGFCLRKKSPAVVVVVFGTVSAEGSGLWFCSGVHNGLVERASGGIAGGEVALCGGVCAPPPRILRKLFILGDCKVMKEATASLKKLCQKMIII